MRALSPTKNFGSWMKKEKLLTKETEETSKEKSSINSGGGQLERSVEGGKKISETEQRKLKGKLKVREGPPNMTNNSVDCHSEVSEEWSRKLREAEQRKAKGKLEGGDGLPNMAKTGRTSSSVELSPAVLEKSPPTKVLWYGKALPPTQKEVPKEELGNAEIGKAKLVGDAGVQEIFPDTTLDETMSETRSTMLRDSKLLLAEVSA